MSKPKIADEQYIGGVYVGREIDKDIFAEELISRRFVIRHRTDPDFALRVGEVCGGPQGGGRREYQATRNSGEHVAMKRSMLAAARTLVHPRGQQP